MVRGSFLARGRGYFFARVRRGVAHAQRHFANEMRRLPITSTLSGTSELTTTEAPITEPAPIFTPGITVQRAPSQLPFPIVIGAEPV